MIDTESSSILVLMFVFYPRNAEALDGVFALDLLM